MGTSGRNRTFSCCSTKTATYYPAIIEIDYNQVNDSERKVILQSGMQSDVSIIGEERTVLSYVLNPITKLSQRALQE